MAKFAEKLRASLFNKQLSKKTTFSLIHLAGQYLKMSIDICRSKNERKKDNNNKESEKERTDMYEYARKDNYESFI